MVALLGEDLVGLPVTGLNASLKSKRSSRKLGTSIMLSAFLTERVVAGPTYYP